MPMRYVVVLFLLLTMAGLCGCSPKKVLSPSPSLYGVSLNMFPHEADAALREQLFKVQEWRSEPPFVVKVYQNSRANDPFAEFELHVCMEPSVVVRLLLHGENVEAIYRASLGKFAAAKGDPDYAEVSMAPLPEPGQTHSRRFAEQHLLRIDTANGSARLMLENSAAVNACTRQLINNQGLLRELELQRAKEQDAELQKVL